MNRAAHLTLNMGNRGLTSSEGSVDPRGPNERGSTCDLELGVETPSTYDLEFGMKPATHLTLTWV